jgi:hypothetical protein
MAALCSLGPVGFVNPESGRSDVGLEPGTLATQGAGTQDPRVHDRRDGDDRSERSEDEREGRPGDGEQDGRHRQRGQDRHNRKSVGRRHFGRPRHCDGAPPRAVHAPSQHDRVRSRAFCPQPSHGVAGWGELGDDEELLADVDPGAAHDAVALARDQATGR